MRRLVITLGLVLLTAGCPTDTGSRPAARPEAPVAGGHADPTPSRPSVADHFSPPGPNPRPAWTRQGLPVDRRELDTFAGPEHCEWQSAVMMHLGWPLGTVATSAAKIRQFIRDPDGAMRYGVPDPLRTAVDLPPDARDTGYRNGELELWLAPSDPDAAYVRAGDDVERWPEADPVVACR